MARSVNPWRDLRGLPSGLWLLAGATLVNRAGTMVRPFLTLYLVQELGFDPEQTAAVLLAFGLAALCGSLVSGRLSDRVSPWSVLSVTLILGGALCTALIGPRTFPAMLGAVALWSFVSEAFRPASTTVVAGLAPPERRLQSFALMRLAVNLGMSIGPALGGWLAESSFRALFLVDGATTILAGAWIGAWASRRGLLRRGASTAGASAHASASWGVLRDRRFLLFLAGVVPVASVFFQIEGAFSLHLSGALGLSKATIGSLLAINTLLIVLVELPLNSYAARWPLARSLVLGALATGVGFGMLAWVDDLGWTVVSIVLWTVGEMLLFPALTAEATAIAPESRRGEYLGLYHVAFGVAAMIGPALGTMVLQRHGSKPLWIGAFAVALLAAAILARAARATRHVTAPRV